MLTLTLTGPVETQNDLATHWTWQTTDGQYKIVRTIPSADGLRPGFVPVHRCAAGGFMPLDRDRDGSSKRYRTLADAVAAVKSHSKAAGNPYSDDNADATVAAARAIDLADIPRRPISEAQLAAQQRFTAAAQCRGTWTHYECPQCSFDQKINPLTVKAGQPPACPKCFSTMQPLADREALADANGIDKTCTACGHNWRDDGSHKTICPNCHRAKMSLTREALNYLDTPPDVPRGNEPLATAGSTDMPLATATATDMPLSQTQEDVMTAKTKKTSASKKTAKTGKSKTGTGSKTAKTAKTAKRTPRTAAASGNGKLSLLDAAAAALATCPAPVTTAELYAAILSSKLWTPGPGLTPVNTLRAAIYVECKRKGKEARFTVKDGKITAR